MMQTISICFNDELIEEAEIREALDSFLYENFDKKAKVR